MQRILYFKVPYIQTKTWTNEYDAGITTINHPFGNGLYQLSMVCWGMVYCCYMHITHDVNDTAADAAYADTMLI